MMRKILQLTKTSKGKQGMSTLSPPSGCSSRASSTSKLLISTSDWNHNGYQQTPDEVSCQVAWSTTMYSKPGGWGTLFFSSVNVRFPLQFLCSSSWIFHVIFCFKGMNGHCVALFSQSLSKHLKLGHIEVSHSGNFVCLYVTFRGYSLPLKRKWNERTFQ